MFARISEQIIDGWINNQAIQHEDRDIYQFGLEKIMMDVLQGVVLCIVGILFHALIECIIFVVVFAKLRKYAGGYHAATGARCFCMTTMTVALALWIMNYVEISNKQCLLILLISAMILFVLTPVEAKNKPLDGIEMIVYRNKSLFIWLAEVVCALISMLLGVNSVVIAITLAHMILGISMIAGKMSLKLLNVTTL